MARLRDLPLDPLAKRWLREEKLDTSEDLWRAIGPQYEKGLGRLEEQTGIVRSHLVHALGAAADAGPERRLTLGKTLFTVLVLALLALAGLRAAEALGLFPFPASGLTAELDQAVVVPRDGLPVFHVLTESDLRLAPRPRTAGGITRKTDALGRYLLRPKRSGSVLRSEDLGPVPLAPEALAGRWIVTLQVDPSALGPQVTPGAEALLLLAAQEGTPSAVTATARVLAIDRGTGDNPTAVTVAIPHDQQEKVAAALGTSKVFLGAATSDRRAAAPRSGTPRP